MLQALYFDKAFHNPTSARMWWDKHKAFFDTREQLMKHLITSSQKALTRFGKRVRRAGSKARPGARGAAQPHATYTNPLTLVDSARPGLRER